MKRLTFPLAAVIATIGMSGTYGRADGHAQGHSHAAHATHTSHANQQKKTGTSHKNQTLVLNKNQVNKNHTHHVHKGHHKNHFFPSSFRWSYARWAPWYGCWVYYDRVTSVPYLYSEGCGCYRPASEATTLAESVDEPDGPPPCPDCENGGARAPEPDMDTPEPPQ